MADCRWLRRVALVACTLFTLAGRGTPEPGAPTATPAPASPVVPTVAPATLTPPPVPPTLTMAPEPTRTPVPPTLTPQPATAVPSVTPAPTRPVPQVVYFTVVPTATLAVDTALFMTWEGIGQQASLCFIGVPGPSGCQDVPLKGSTTVTVTADMLTNTGVGLRVTSGDTFVWSIVDLQFDCGARDWWFENHPKHCPQQAPVPSHAAGQSFEHGFMIWTETPDTFYVFFNEGQEFLFAGAPYDLVTPSVVAVTPPAGYYEPVSGFGKVWHHELAAFAGVDFFRLLGWATAPEFAFDTVKQCDSYGRLWSCYLRDADGGVLWLRPDSTAQVRLLWERLEP